MSEQQPLQILLAEDDEDDILLTREAMEEAHLLNELRVVKDGQELLDYLFRKGDYNKENAPRPGLILLDINMPRVSGYEALEEIKKDPELWKIPVVVVTTSKAEQDIVEGYRLGVAGYCIKPVGFDQFVEIIKSVEHYWFQIVEVPELPS